MASVVGCGPAPRGGRFDVRCARLIGCACPDFAVVCNPHSAPQMPGVKIFPVLA